MLIHKECLELYTWLLTMGMTKAFTMHGLRSHKVKVTEQLDPQFSQTASLLNYHTLPCSSIISEYKAPQLSQTSSLLNNLRLSGSLTISNYLPTQLSQTSWLLNYL